MVTRLDQNNGFYNERMEVSKRFNDRSPLQIDMFTRPNGCVAIEPNSIHVSNSRFNSLKAKASSEMSFQKKENFGQQGLRSVNALSAHRFE